MAQRPKFRRYFTPKDLQSLLLGISRRALFVEVSSKVELSRDPKDDFLLALAKDGKANYLVTGDKDLLVLKKFGRTRILTLSEYVATL